VPTIPNITQSLTRLCLRLVSTFLFRVNNSRATNNLFYKVPKRLAGSLSGHGPPSKKAKIGFLHDVSLAEASKFGSLNDFAYFDRVRKTIRNPDAYDTFIRCITLFNQV